MKCNFCGRIIPNEDHQLADRCKSCSTDYHQNKTKKFNINVYRIIAVATMEVNAQTIKEAKELAIKEAVQKHSSFKTFQVPQTPFIAFKEDE